MSIFAPYSPNYLLLDAARMLSDMDNAQEMNTQFVSLYKGGTEQHLSSVAPYLFQYGVKLAFDNWVGEHTGNSWGIYIKCKADMEDMSYHFRRFLKVKTEDMQQLYFRFYDPRVLRIFLPTCDKKQLIEFFGPIEYFICEQAEENNFKVYSHQQGTLKEEEFIKKKVTITIPPEPISSLPILAETDVKPTEKSKVRKWL